VGHGSMEVILEETKLGKEAAKNPGAPSRSAPAARGPKTGDEKAVVIAYDDGIRPQASIADLSRLRAVFKKSGTTTAGSRSQVSDAALRFS